MAKILVLDDDLIQLEQIKKWLNPFYEVRLILQSEFLFKRIEDEKFDLILLDVYMPGEGGLSLLKKLKSHQTHRDIPVIMLVSDNQLIEECLEGGAIDYLGKPINQTVLKQRIKNSLSSVRNPLETLYSSNERWVS